MTANASRPLSISPQINLNHPVELTFMQPTMNPQTQYSIPTRTRSMSLKQLNIKIPEQELRILEAFANKTERTKTDIIREFIRSLQSKI
jgi:hypothetical protein